jgi:hypothetical protein
MRVYIAGAFIEQHFRARPMMAKLRDAGVTISHDWTQAEGNVCSCGHEKRHHAPQASCPASGWRATTSTRCEWALPTGHVGDIERCPCSAFNGIGVGSDSALTPKQRKQFALDDLQGVLTADVVWLLAANSQGASGSWVELGAALALRSLRTTMAAAMKNITRGELSPPPKIIVSGPKWQRTIFTELADKTFSSDDEALECVKGAASRGEWQQRGVKT